MGNLILDHLSAGPYCSICAIEGKYFKESEARCIDCPEPGDMFLLVMLVLLPALVVIFVLFRIYNRPPRRLRNFSRQLHRLMIYIHEVSFKAKAKQVVSFFQGELCSQLAGSRMAHDFLHNSCRVVIACASRNRSGECPCYCLQS